VAVGHEAGVEHEHAPEEHEHASEEEIHVNEAAMVAKLSPLSVSPARPRKQKSALQTMLEVTTGGVAGCLVAYYLLAWWFGPDLRKRGFPIFKYLPGITRLTRPSELLQPVSGEAAKQPEATKATSPQGEAQEPAQTPAAESPPNAAAIVAPVPSVEPSLLRPQPGSANYLGPRMPVTVTPNQLGKALKDAGPIVANAKGEKAMSAQAYQVLCRLGEAVTFVNGDASDKELINHIEDANALLKEVAAQPDAGKKLAPLAADRLDAHLGKTAGVLLAGTVKSLSKQDRLFDATVQIPGRTAPVNILSDRMLPVKAGESVFVLGVVVHDPKANLVGYGDTKGIVVWSGALAKAP
jgi:hypothetical protein